jgi:hypothetical protein
MDSLITAAARALAAGDPLGALKRVALRDDAPALALRGIAMAQLGDLVRAKALLRSAARAFGPREAVARARCVVAEAEIALVSRDLGWPAKALDAARATLETHGDRVNAAHARNLEVRRLLLIGRFDEAERTLAELDPTPLPPASRAAHEMVVAGIAVRRSPCASSIARAASSAFAGQPRSRETSAISASATTHLARATASFGPNARAALRRRTFARTRSPSCAIAMPRSAMAQARRPGDPVQYAEGITPGERTRRGCDQRVHRNPATLVTPIVRCRALRLSHDQK